jgi:hypothetical protein
MGPATVFHAHMDRDLNYNNLRGLFTKMQGIRISPDLISNGKSMDRVHGVVGR